MPDTFDEEVRFADKKLDKVFGILELKDLSEYETMIYNDFQNKLKTKTFTEIKNEIEQELSLNRDQYHTPVAYFDSIENPDEEAQNIRKAEAFAQTQISKLEKEALDLSNVLKDKEAILSDALKKKDAAEKKYQEHLDSVNKKYKKNADKAQVKEDKRVDKINMKEYLPAHNKSLDLKEKIADTEFEISKMKDSVTAYQKKMANENPESAEYKKNSEEVTKIMKEVERLSKAVMFYTQDKAEVDAKIEEITKNVNSTASIEKDVAKNSKEYMDDMDSIEKYRKAFEEATLKYNAALKDKNDTEYKKELASQGADNYHKKLNDIRDEKTEYARRTLDAKYRSLTEQKKNMESYKEISDALTNTVPKRNTTSYVKGLAEVTNVYKNYFVRHSLFGRAMGHVFGSLTSAGREYNKYCDLRDKYLRFSGMKREDVDYYLDTGVLQNSLAEECHGYENAIASLTETSMDKSFCPKNGATLPSYLSSARNYFDNVLYAKTKNGISGPLAYVKADKSLLMLNALGDLKRANPKNKELDDFIKHVTDITSAFCRASGRTSTIDAEIANALLPVSERKIIEAKPGNWEIRDVKAIYDENEKLKRNEENAVLYELTEIKHPEKYQIEVPVWEKNDVNEDFVDVNEKENVLENDMEREIE